MPAIKTNSSLYWLAGCLLLFVSVVLISCTTTSGKLVASNDDKENTEAAEQQKELLTYGKALIANTAYYLGPKGSVAPLTNGMNCQNCHLDAGQRLYANSYFTVATNYPKFSPRSGSAETIVHKVNDCMERSLNGTKLDTASREMQAMVAYIKSVGKEADNIAEAAAKGTQQLALLSRAASPERGNVLYHEKCTSCHGNGGEGLLAANGISYTYPPLWGPHSYNVSAGIFKISKLAGFIKNNMPFGATYEAPQLTDEQAWDIAAFINSQPRNTKQFANDWPDISRKPFDYPFAPYKDHFSEKQHKYGPFQIIMDDAKKKQKVNKK